MSKQDRTTLKSFFRGGALPTAEHYRDLIDSAVNQVDDGFDKTTTDGMKLASVGSSLRLMSFYQGLGTREPSWTIEHGQAPGRLHLRQAAGVDSPAADPPKPQAGAAALTLTRDGRTGLGCEDPAWRLDVAGTARMAGRIGVASAGMPHVPADGRWHDITPAITGCQAFEVMAGTGGDRAQGRYALLHAVAMNAFHPRNAILNWLFGRRRIRSQTAVYGSYADRLQLRWVASEPRHHFKLQLRSAAHYGDGKIVRYYLTRLWFDSLMDGARGGPDRDGGTLL
ncbi:MAG: hypothetical protein ACXIU8_06675 [Alkalilacustris sp.]